MECLADQPVNFVIPTTVKRSVVFVSSRFSGFPLAASGPLRLVCPLTSVRHSGSNSWEFHETLAVREGARDRWDFCGFSVHAGMISQMM